MIAKIRSTITRGAVTAWLLAVVLFASELLYLQLVRFEAANTTRSVITFLANLCLLFVLYAAAYLLLKATVPSRTVLTIVLIGTVLFRLTLLFAGLPPRSTWGEARSRLHADIHGQAVTYDSYLLFDNDIWRYLWDGHVSSAGLSPYVFEPRSAELDGLAAPAGDATIWADIRANVNHNDVPTIYPPLAQVIFRTANAIAPGSVFVMKLLLIASDFLTVFLMLLVLRRLRRPMTDVILYGWNPLVIKVVAGSGHIDAVLGTLLVLMVWALIRKRLSLAAIAWGLAILTKTTPILLLPFIGRRIGWRRTSLGLGILIAGYIPFLDTRGSPFLGLITFGKEWQFNSGFFRLMESLLAPFNSNPAGTAKTLAMTSVLVVLVWLMYRDTKEQIPFHTLAVSALGALLVFSPTVMPWYVISILPLAVIAHSRLWIQFSPLLCLSFFVMIDGTERPFVLLLEWGGFAAIVFSENFRWKRQQLPITAQEICEGTSQ